MNAKTQYKLLCSDLEMLLSLSRTGTLAQAGERLGLDPSTVFRNLQRVEKGLGQSLFVRSRRGYQASELTIELLAVAERVEALVEEARALTQSQPEQISGCVRITTTDTILHALVSPSLQLLHQRHPFLSFDLHTGNELASLTRRDADIAIRATNKPPPHLIGKHVGPIRVAAYVSENSSLRALDTSTAKAHCWIAPDDALPEHPSVIWRKKHFPEVIPAYKVNSILTVADMIDQNFGVGLLPVFLAKKNPRLRQITAILDECQTELWLLTHTESRHLRRVSSVFSHLAQSIKLV